MARTDAAQTVLTVADQSLAAGIRAADFYVSRYALYPVNIADVVVRKLFLQETSGSCDYAPCAGTGRIFGRTAEIPE